MPLTFPTPRRARVATIFVGIAVAMALSLLSGPAGATESSTDDAPAEGAGGSADEDVLIRGAGVYTDSCSGCHQPGGVGLPGQFPPLVDNPNVADLDYLRSVILNGREGELVVNGVTYDGRMPAFSTLPDDDVAAVIAFIDGGLVVPTGGGAVESPGPGGGDTLPEGANMMMTLAFLIAGAVGLFVLLPRITSAHDGLEMPWLDAGLKGAIIVVAFVAFTVIVPDWAMQTSTVNKLDRPVQDFVGTSLWLGGLVVTLGGVWWAHREKRI